MLPTKVGTEGLILGQNRYPVVHIPIYIYMYVYLGICIYVFMYIYIYRYLHVYSHSHQIFLVQGFRGLGLSIEFRINARGFPSLDILDAKTQGQLDVLKPRGNAGAQPL